MDWWDFQRKHGPRIRESCVRTIALKTSAEQTLNDVWKSCSISSQPTSSRAVLGSIMPVSYGVTDRMCGRLSRTREYQSRIGPIKIMNRDYMFINVFQSDWFFLFLSGHAKWAKVTKFDLFLQAPESLLCLSWVFFWNEVEYFWVKSEIALIF